MEDRRPPCPGTPQPSRRAPSPGAFATPVSGVPSSALKAPHPRLSANYTWAMSWTDRPPSWLPPLPPPNKGRALIVVGWILVGGTFVYIFVMSYLGGTHTLFTLVPLLLGLLCLIIGLLRRDSRQR